jgi:hypothetical protein
LFAKPPKRKPKDQESAKRAPVERISIQMKPDALSPALPLIVNQKENSFSLNQDVTGLPGILTRHK